MTEDQITLPFEATIDGRRVERYLSSTAGKLLEARVLPVAQWSEQIRPYIQEPVSLYLFETPAANYLPLEEEIESLSHKETELGIIPTVIPIATAALSRALQQDSYTDVMAVAKRDSGIGFAGRIRVAKGDIQQDGLMTLDELKLLALIYLGTPQTMAIPATVVPMTAWGERGRLVIAGFTLGRESGLDYGVMVDHTGHVSCYHGESPQDIRERLGL